MKMARQRKRRDPGWQAWALLAAALFFTGVIPAQALLITLDIGWGYNYGGAGTSVDLASEYNLQEGSIVQVVMYNSADAGPGPDADDNFLYHGGAYAGPSLPAEPYDSGSEHYPTDTTAYKPYTTPSGHEIVAEFAVAQAATPDDEGDVWYQVLEQFRVLGDYDRLYVRVFGATEFPVMTVVASYWGLSEVQNAPENQVLVWYVGPGVIDDIVASNKNYFEVIPEPGSLALMVLGMAGLVAGRRRRRDIPR